MSWMTIGRWIPPTVFRRSNVPGDLVRVYVTRVWSVGS